MNYLFIFTNCIEVSCGITADKKFIC